MENNSYKILLVDDEPDILEFIGYNLEKEGYKVFKAYDGKQALKIAVRELPHLIILDVMMPGQDGFQTCKMIREIPELKDVLIMFLSARSEDYAQIEGLESGADDYIGKPVKPIVLKSKIKALLRRIVGFDNTINPNTINIADIFIDKEMRIVKKAGKAIYLSKKEFDLLFLLLSKPEKVFTRYEIIDKVWDNDVIVGGRTVDVHIRKIREKTEILNIITIKGVGYKFSIDEIQNNG